MPGGRDAVTSSLATADWPGGSTRPRPTQDTGGLALCDGAWCTEDLGPSETHSLVFELKCTPGVWGVKSQLTHL